MTGGGQRSRVLHTSAGIALRNREAAIGALSNPVIKYDMSNFTFARVIATYSSRRSSATCAM